MRTGLRSALAALVLVGSACSSSSDPNAGSASSVPQDSAAADTSVVNSEPATTTTAAPVVTTPLTAEQVAFTEVARVPGALDLAYRSGDNTLFVASREGQISAIRNGVLDPKPVLDLTSIISAGGERGLLGLTFSTDGQNAYLDYTNTDGNTVIAEYAVGTDGVFEPTSQRQMLTINQPSPNHNGGALRIGPDGFLYIGMGDGGAANDPDRRALNTSELLGKILRIDPKASASAPYSIPKDNPFANDPKARPEIWAIGMRNPWRFNFDQATGDLWIADVGQNAWEEIDVAWAGLGGIHGWNFGWSAYEGTHRFNVDQPGEQVTMPIYEYQHGDAGCSISGGVRYRGTAVPSLVGSYVYGDYCSGRVRALHINDDRSIGAEVTLSTTMAATSSIAQGPDGELYVLRIETGEVLALVAANS
jgi:glucose/arabinose dehydrogenase